MRRAHKHLFDMLTAGEEIRQITAGKTLEHYQKTRLLQLGVERCLITMGEAATVVLRDEPDLILRFPELAEIKGLQNRVVHDYDHIDDTIVWKSVTMFLPDFLERVRPYIETALQ